tara:strand:- start:64 stop:273 length:210 start_codon:yes stop_codon:yes gene_type:complete
MKDMYGVSFLSPLQGDFLFCFYTPGFARGYHVPARWAECFKKVKIKMFKFQTMRLPYPVFFQPVEKISK